MSTHTLTLPHRVVQTDHLGFFRYTDIGHGKVVLTNDAGEWSILPEATFRAFLAGQMGTDHPDYAPMAAKGFFRDALDLDDMAAKIRRKRFYAAQGPHLHVMITTLRCNQSCRYCHASREDMTKSDVDMSPEVVRHAVDMAFCSTSPYICFEYTGGEPTANMEAIQLAVAYANHKKKTSPKTVDHSVVTNMSFMNEEVAEWLMDHEVLVCTSLDGPKDLHDWNRGWQKREYNFPRGVPMAGSSAYDQVLRWMAYFNRRYIERGKDPDLWHIDALMTTTRRSLPRAREIVDLYVELGLRSLKIRPLNPYGFATKTWRQIGYTMEEYLAFYEEVLDYIIELNLQGVEIQEGTAAIFLQKMMTPFDPNYVDIRSPIGSGTGQVAYNFDGRIFPSDEGRMLAGMGSDFVQIGTLGETSYAEMIGHPTVRSLVMSSYLDALPACHSCFGAPYCGVRPINNFMESGDLFAQRPNTPKCAEHMGIMRLLFDRLAQDVEGKVEAIFRRWTIQRPRDDA